MVESFTSVKSTRAISNRSKVSTIHCERFSASKRGRRTTITIISRIWTATIQNSNCLRFVKRTYLLKNTKRAFSTIRKTASIIVSYIWHRATIIAFIRPPIGKCSTGDTFQVSCSVSTRALLAGFRACSTSMSVLSIMVSGNMDSSLWRL